MPYCPRCHKVYKEIYRLCPVCKTVMLDKEPPVQKRANLSDSEILKIFNELDDFFSSKLITHNNFYILPFEIRESMIYDSSIVRILQQIADNMCLFLGLFNNTRVIYIEEGLDKYNNLNRVFSCEANGTIRTFERERDFAGLYDSKYGNHQIQIVKKKGYKISHLMGILAHEITHHFLRYYGIGKNNEIENEIFTDITAVYLGFGHLLHRAYKVISYNADYVEKADKSYSYTTYERTIGYITPETILKALAISCEKKGWNPKEVIKSIETGSERSNISRKLLKYRIRLFNSKISLFRERIKTKKQKTRYHQAILTLNSIQQKYNKVKNIIDELSHNDSKSISKDDGAFLVKINNQIFSLNIESEIKNKIKLIKDSETKRNLLSREFYRSINKLETLMNSWISRLNEIK